MFKPRARIAVLPTFVTQTLRAYIPPTAHSTLLPRRGVNRNGVFDVAAESTDDSGRSILTEQRLTSGESTERPSIGC